MIKKLHILFLVIFISLGNVFGQSKTKDQVWEFMVRNTAKLEDVAVKFRTSEEEIRKKNSIKGKYVYPGSILSIPVRTQLASWDPNKFNPNESSLPAEFSKPRKDYELDLSALDPDVLEDFIVMEDLIADSAILDRIEKSVVKIERKIRALTITLDSIKRAEMEFAWDENDVSSVLKRMEMARQAYYAKGPIGKEIDSLGKLKENLSVEMSRIRSRVTEYEYLRDNQYFFQKKKYRRQTKKS